MDGSKKLIQLKRFDKSLYDEFMDLIIKKNSYKIFEESYENCEDFKDFNEFNFKIKTSNKIQTNLNYPIYYKNDVFTVYFNLSNVMSLEEYNILENLINVNYQKSVKNIHANYIYNNFKNSNTKESIYYDNDTNIFNNYKDLYDRLTTNNEFFTTLDRCESLKKSYKNKINKILLDDKLSNIKVDLDNSTIINQDVKNLELYKDRLLDVINSEKKYIKELITLNTMKKKNVEVVLSTI